VPRVVITGRSLLAGSAGLALLLAGAGVFAIHLAVVFIVDARARAEMQAKAQSLANAAALGSAAELPRGIISVIRAASSIVGSPDAQRSLRGSRQEVQVGYWDAERQIFSTGATKPDAVQITIRLANPCSHTAFLGVAEDQIEAHAIAVLKPVGKSLVAEACAPSASTTR
jgi:Putative Tad-like Flp pilus-assembly